MNTDKTHSGNPTPTALSPQPPRQEKKTPGIGSIVFFVLVTGFTLYAIFYDQDFQEILSALKNLSLPCLLLCTGLALFFVCAEGTMIWYLLRALNEQSSSLSRCISYSFIGFFYSGITPSATGGQPMQLYYMTKDNNPLSNSSVVLMAVAVVYKFVLAVIGILMLVFWFEPLSAYLKGYFGLFMFGLLLNAALVVILLAVMIAPGWMKGFLYKTERLLMKIRILKPSDSRGEKINGFVDGYRDAVHFFARHKRKIGVVVLLTFLQRCSVFLLTAVIYRGFSQSGTSFFTVMLLQAAVVIAVDMLPLPGAQGISELMYCRIFTGVFTTGYLMPSLYVTRGITFYFLLIVSLLIVIGNQMYRRYCK